MAVYPAPSDEGGTVEAGTGEPGGGIAPGAPLALAGCYGVQTFFVTAPKTQQFFVSADELPDA
jgi:hypothetical protein